MTINKSKTLILVGFNIFAALFFLAFQNCSGDMRAASLVRPFEIGERFEFERLPLKSQMLEVQINELNYHSYPNAKAIAINALGLGFVSLKASGLIEEARQTALEGCYVIGGGQPCGIVAEGDSFAFNQIDLPGVLQFVLTKETTLNNKIPLLTFGQRDTVYTNYSARSNPKALAIALEGGYFIVSHTSEKPVGSIEEARRLVLERCELEMRTSPCILYAENVNVVFEPDRTILKSVIDYNRTTIHTNIPGMRNEIFTNNIQNNYLQNLGNNFGAIYITSRGAGGMARSTISQEDADSKALDFCNAEIIGTDYVCVKYAQGATIFVDMLTMLKGLSSDPEIHCKVMPRESCAAHKSMGCSGSVYIYNPQGIPQLSVCS